MNLQFPLVSGLISDNAEFELGLPIWTWRWAITKEKSADDHHDRWSLNKWKKWKVKLKWQWHIDYFECSKLIFWMLNVERPALLDLELRLFHQKFQSASIESGSHFLAQNILGYYIQSKTTTKPLKQCWSHYPRNCTLFALLLC